MTRQDIPTNYIEAMIFLGGRSSRTVCNNTALHLGDGECHLELHATTVVTFHSNGAQTLNTGGWHPATTKDRINRSLGTLGSVYQRKGEWFFRASGMLNNNGPNGPKECPFRDGMKVMRAFEFPRTILISEHDATFRNGLKLIRKPRNEWGTKADSLLERAAELTRKIGPVEF